MENELLNQQLVNEIMNIGEAMVKNGAESGLVEHRLQNVFKSYGAKSSSVYALPSKIELSVVTRSDQIITEIRKVKRDGRNYGILENVNAFAKRLCLETSDAQTVHREFEEEIKKKALPDRAVALGAMFVAVGFSVFYACNLLDTVISAAVCALVMLLFGKQVQKHSGNLFVYNFVMTLVCGVAVAAICSLTGDSHPDRIMLGLIMLLISGLDFTNGIGDILNNNIFSGLLSLSRSVVGALAISFGAMMAFSQMAGDPGSVLLASDPAVLIISAGAAVFGFGLLFHMPLVQCICAGCGGLVCTAIYALAGMAGLGEYVCIFLGALFVSAYAAFESYHLQVPASVFISPMIMPLVPGASMYYMLLGLGMKNYSFALDKTMVILQTGFTITIAFTLVQIAVRNIYHITKAKKEKDV